MFRIRPIGDDDLEPKALQAAIYSQEHRLIASILNFLFRKQFRKDDPRRRATLISLITIVFSPGNAVVLTAAVGGVVSAVLLAHQNHIMEEQNLDLRSQIQAEQRRADQSSLRQALVDLQFNPAFKGTDTARVSLRAFAFREFLRLQSDRVGQEDGVEVFSKSSGVFALNGADLRGLTIENLRIEGVIDISGSNLRGTNISNTSFEKIVASGTDFRKSSLNGVLFEEIACQNCNFEEARISGSWFKSGDIRDSNFSKSRVFVTNFGDLNGIGAFYDFEAIEGTNFESVNMSNADERNVSFIDGWPVAESFESWSRRACRIDVTYTERWGVPDHRAYPCPASEQ